MPHMFHEVDREQIKNYFTEEVSKLVITQRMNHDRF